MADTTQLMKTDNLGRLTYRKEHREALLDKFERGAMSAKAFAEHCGVNYQTFATWLHKRRRARKAKSEPAKYPGKMELVELSLESPAVSGEGALEVELPGGAKVKVSSPGQLPLLKALLGELSC